MKKKSCRNCQNLNLRVKEEAKGRLSGRYRYGCLVQRSGYICGFIISDDKLEALECPEWRGGKAEKTDCQRLAEEYGEELQKLYDRWCMWRTNGCPEAEVTDGEYLNRLRSGIEAMVKQIEGLFDETDYPECYYAPLPPVMAADYMANCPEIKAAAVHALDEYRKNPDYVWLADRMNQLENADKENSEIYRLLCHAESLEEAIRTNNYLRMKRESCQGSLFDDMASCKKRILNKKRKSSGRKSKKNSHQIIGQLDIDGLRAS